MTALRELIEAVEQGGQLALDDTAKAWDETHPYAYSTLAPLTLKAAAGSLDAARALHEAVLPGWSASADLVFLEGVQGFTFRVHPYGRGHTYYADADNPARAWLLSILKAMEAQQ